MKRKVVRRYTHADTQTTITEYDDGLIELYLEDPRSLLYTITYPKSWDAAVAAAEKFVKKGALL